LNITKTINYWEGSKASYYQWLSGLSWIKMVPLCGLMAGITGIAAQIRIVLPFTPVPITGQVFAVLLSGILLGNLYGGISMSLYFIFGCAGIPWFSGASYGIGPTTGYIIGFIPAALFIGIIARRQKTVFLLIATMSVAIFIIYFFGAIGLSFFMHTNLKQTLLMAILPFIPVDLLKAVIAAVIARAMFVNGGS
jgi:biotin transport system substrate-specific component